MMTLEVNGIQYTGFTTASTFRSLESVSGAFKFEATASEKIKFPIKVGDACRVLIDGKPVNDGYVEAVVPSYSVDSHKLSISGRDKTMDMIDSSMVNEGTYQGAISLKTIIERSLKDGSINNVSVIDNVSGLESFDASDIQSAAVGETIFSFVEKYARKRQVLLTGDGEGNVIITRSGVEKASTSLFNIVDGDSNNLIAGSAQYDDTDIFNKYVIKSQSSLGGLLSSASITPSDVVNQSGTETDSSARVSRQIEIIPPTSMPTEDAGKYALWQKNLRRAKAFVASLTVHGFAQGNGDLWQPNLLVDIHDDFLGRRGTFLIKSVENTLSVDEGERTIIELVERDSYTLDNNAETFENDEDSLTALLG